MDVFGKISGWGVVESTLRPAKKKPTILDSLVSRLVVKVWGPKCITTHLPSLLEISGEPFPKNKSVEHSTSVLVKLLLQHVPSVGGCSIAIVQLFRSCVFQPSDDALPGILVDSA